MVDAAHYRRELSSVIAGRPWIVALDVLVAASSAGQVLLDLGATKVLALGGSRGTGEIAEDPRVELIDLGLRGADMMDGIRRTEAAFEALPADAQAKVDRFDPRHEARVIRSPFASGQAVGGRAVFGPRFPSWVALEDKTRVDAFWDAAGVRRAPSRVVPVQGDDAWRAHAALDAGHGTVWVADNREGFHGGAQLLRWVRGEGDAAEAQAFLASHADDVRVMPFLDGVSCSIHGVVFDDHVIAFRPCELLVFRVPGQSHLVYAGAATFWLPAPEVTAELRRVARRVGAELRTTVDYRGAFTVDGVLTEDGFRPTELNPRYGAALARLAAGEPELPLYLLHLAVTDGAALDYRPVELEGLLLAASLRFPSARCHWLLPLRVEAEREAGLLRGEDGRLRFNAPDEEPTFEVRLGAAASGAFLQLVPNATSLPMGASVGPAMVEALAFLDAAWGLGLGPLEAAG